MCCHSLDILCAFAATQQKYEYPYQRDVESRLMAAIYVLSTGPTVWFQYLEAPILCHWDISAAWSSLSANHLQESG